MTRPNNTRKLTLAAALAATAAVGIFAQIGPASAARNVLNCEGNSRVKVIDCCQKIYNQRRPLWMMNSNVSCHKVVTCKGGRRSITGALAPKRCWVKYQPPSPNDTKPRPEPKQRDPAGKPSVF